MFYQHITSEIKLKIEEIQKCFYILNMEEKKDKRT